MREVVFLGLHPEAEVNSLVESSAEVWTLNDWFVRFPALTNPARVYQIHEGFKAGAPTGRMPHGWRDRYEWSKALVVTIEDLCLTRQRVVDRAYLRERFGGPGFFGSTFSYMFADAIMERVESVRMVGVRLSRNSEYRTQVPVTLHNLSVARENGIYVECPYEGDWLSRGAVASPHNLDWMYGELSEKKA